MKQIEGRIIVTFSNTDVSEQQILLTEQYLNKIVDSIVYANMGASIRVHLEAPTKQWEGILDADTTDNS